MVAAVSQSASPEELAGQRRALAGLADLAIPLARWLAVGTLLLVTVIVVSRRLAGGLTGPASAFAVFAVAAAGAGLVSVADRFEPARSPPGGWLVGWFTRGCLLATLAAVGLFWPPSLITVVTAMLMFGAMVCLSPRAGWRPRPPGVGIELPQLPQLPQLPRWPWLTRRAIAAKPNVAHASSSENLRPPALPGQLIQWQERYLLTDGREELRGQLVLTLAAESRLATGHVGFCPALPSIPDVIVTTDYDALEVVVDAAEVLPWGIRVECRVEDPADEPVVIPVDIRISLPAAVATTRTDPTD
jgi:hypothetical protein